ncbi:MAG: D-alanine--D-alanine ligase [Eubacteriales bacterium]
MDYTDKRITVVCGGISTEREVSIRSGKAIYEALLGAGYKNVALFDLLQNNLNTLLAESPDLAFLALHGKGGEDGCIQGALELAGIRYTGSGVAASAVCMDKILTKKLLSFHSIPTPAFVVLENGECHDAGRSADLIIEKLGLPVVLKSPCQGSSIGIVIANDRKGVEQGIGEILRFGDRLLAEKFTDGTEVTLPLTGNRKICTYPVIEITSENSFYDYTSKYTPGMSHHIIPARIDANDIEKIREYGCRAYRAAGCRGLARIDFIVDKKAGPMVIEINSLPGMTETSLFPDAARYDGVSFPQLVDRIVKLAFSEE